MVCVSLLFLFLSVLLFVAVFWSSCCCFCFFPRSAFWCSGCRGCERSSTLPPESVFGFGELFFLVRVNSVFSSVRACKVHPFDWDIPIEKSLHNTNEVGLH